MRAQAKDGVLRSQSRPGSGGGRERQAGRPVTLSPRPSCSLQLQYLPLHLPIGSPTTTTTTTILHGLYGPRNRAPSRPSVPWLGRPRSHLASRAQLLMPWPGLDPAASPSSGTSCSSPRCLSGRTSRRTTAREPLPFFPPGRRGMQATDET